MTLQTRLGELEATGLIRLAQAQPEVEYLFRHALVHEAAHDSLVKSDRRNLHLVVGETLERLYPGRLESRKLAPVLARHFDEASSPERAMHYYALAGQAAVEKYANAEAAQYYAQALAAAGAHEAANQVVADLYLRRGRALELSAQDAQAVRNYEEMEAWARDRASPEHELAALSARATVLIKPSVVLNPPEGRALAERALALARALGDRPAEARALWNLMMYHQVVWRLGPALEYGEQALAIARELGLRELTAYVLTDLQTVYFAMGQPERARAGLAEARALWRELGVLNMLAGNLASSATTHVFSGEYDQALRLSAEALQVSNSIGNLWNQAYSWYMIDLVHFDRGDTGKAIEVAQESIRVSEQAGFAAGLIETQLNLAIIYGFLGAHSRARQAIARARSQIDRLHGLEETMASPFAEGVQAYLHFASGDLAAAVEVSDKIQLPGGASSAEREYLSQVFLLQAELALARGDAAHALRLADEMIAYLGQMGVRLLVGDTWLIKGRALLAAGALAEGEAALAQARSVAEAIGSRRALWQILNELSRLEAAAGRTAEARRLLGEAKELVEYIAGHTGLPDLRASFLSRPDVRSVVGA